MLADEGIRAPMSFFIFISAQVPLFPVQALLEGRQFEGNSHA